MKFTIPVYITLDAATEEEAQQMVAETVESVKCPYITCAVGRSVPNPWQPSVTRPGSGTVELSEDGQK